jgi:death-on-curing protein
MPGSLFLTVAEAVEIHRQLIAEFGGSAVLRDKGRLEAALFRPQVGYYADLVEEAAVLMESLVNNHPFVDGNKRAGLAITDTFLRLNGYCLELRPRTAYRFVMRSMARGEFRFPVIREWLRAHLRPLRRTEG